MSFWFFFSFVTWQFVMSVWASKAPQLVFPFQCVCIWDRIWGALGWLACLFCLICDSASAFFLLHFSLWALHHWVTIQGWPTSLEMPLMLYTHILTCCLYSTHTYTAWVSIWNFQGLLIFCCTLCVCVFFLINLYIYVCSYSLCVLASGFG